MGSTREKGDKNIDMKVLILGDGSSIHMIKWINGLLKHNVEIVLYSLIKFDRSLYISSSKLTTYNLGFTGKAVMEKQNSLFKMNYFKSIPEIKKIIKQHNPDILHAHYASSYGLIGSFFKFKPYVVSVWGSDVYEFPKKNILFSILLKRVFKKATVILSTSETMAKEVSKYSNKEVLITPFGVDVDKFTPQHKSPAKNEIVVGTIKTLLPIYGIDTLIEAFAILVEMNPDLNLKLQIVGKGSEKERLIEMVNSKNVTDKVEFLGFIANEEVPSYLNRFDLYVALSREESFGVAIVEAMACETPVVVSDAEGLSEVVENGVSGFVVPKDNPHQAALKMDELIKNPSLKSTFGINGRNRVLEHYNWSKNLQKMIDIYNGVL